MKTISASEILQLYKRCGVDGNGIGNARTNINTGSLDNKLNTNFSYINRNSAMTIWSDSASVKK